MCFAKSRGSLVVNSVAFVFCCLVEGLTHCKSQCGCVFAWSKGSNVARSNVCVCFTGQNAFRMLFHRLERLKCPKLLCCCMFLHGRSLLNPHISLRSLSLNIYWCCLSVLSKTLAHSDAFREMYGPPAQKTKKCVGSLIFFRF